ncbi:hypothetical protein GJ654_00435 [Rhodoblastus acidophilus]|uniref:DUF1311 domain-containing protein n=1 Tax=Rhodoblastus acidophilus TaxID=1074 RepID=A0A6N8DGR0_RHOAC|nr:hypothetical protein [Rhodoblastus acidophilus]MCW2272537.1 hypothetical protein [Rhodoblastus acidophilus]MTV29452.1 hypothetical protein [Rhodoblastus acidophilus]
MRACLLLLALVIPVSASAQLALPGAVTAPTPEGQALAAPKPSAPAKPREHFAPVKPKPPAESAVLGQTFGLNGARGALTLDKVGDELRVTRLVLSGAKVSHPNQSCEVSMGDDGPIKLKALGAPEGANRFELQSSACPMLIDVLGGALRVTTPFGACVFFAADCRADVAGLWGPPGSAFSDSQNKTFDRERAGLEKSAQARFRALLARYKKQPDLAKDLVKDQADFGAMRARTCRDYDREETHGFCALRLTEARDLALQTRIADAGEDKEARKAETKKRKPATPRPAAAPAPAPTPQPGAD